MRDLELPEDLKNKYTHIDNTLEIKDYLKLLNKKNPKKNNSINYVLIFLLILSICAYLYQIIILFRRNVIRII
jgi:hypothetical protein